MGPFAPSLVSLFRPTPLRLMSGKGKGAKTKSAVMKRMRQTSSGSLKLWSGGTQHNTGHMSRNRNNRLATSGGIKEPAIEVNMKKMMNLK